MSIMRAHFLRMNDLDKIQQVFTMHYMYMCTHVQIGGLKSGSLICII